MSPSTTTMFNPTTRLFRFILKSPLLSSKISSSSSTRSSSTAFLHRQFPVRAFSSSSSISPIQPKSRHSFSRRNVSSMSAVPSGTEILASFGKRANEFEGLNIPHAMESLVNADCVCFDVDSTVIQEEGIDILAESLGKMQIVSEWTTKAMTGNVKFEDALSARLDILQPSRDAILSCLEKHPFQITPHVEDLVEELQSRGTSVYFVSGGFRIMIEPLARQLCVAKSNIYANTILFDSEGKYEGFDAEEYTSKDMGKPKALQAIREQGGYEHMVMVGDGVTDAQARPPADAFIGFGGVVVREAVKEKADWYVMHFEDMVEIVERFGGEERGP